MNGLFVLIGSDQDVISRLVDSMNGVISEFCSFIFIIRNSAQSAACGLLAQSILVDPSTLHSGQRRRVIKLLFRNVEIWIIRFLLNGLALTSSRVVNTLLLFALVN